MRDVLQQAVVADELSVAVVPGYRRVANDPDGAVPANDPVLHGPGRAVLDQLVGLGQNLLAVLRHHHIDPQIGPCRELRRRIARDGHAAGTVIRGGETAGPDRHHEHVVCDGLGDAAVPLLALLQFGRSLRDSLFQFVAGAPQLFANARILD